FRRGTLAERHVDFRPQIKKDIGVAVVLDFLFALAAGLRIRNKAEPCCKTWGDEQSLSKPDLFITRDRARPHLAGEALAEPDGHADLTAQFYIADTVRIELIAAADDSV